MTAGYPKDNLREWKQNAGSKAYFIRDDERHPLLEVNGAGAVTASITY